MKSVLTFFKKIYQFIENLFRKIFGKKLKQKELEKILQKEIVKAQKVDKLLYFRFKGYSKRPKYTGLSPRLKHNLKKIA